MSWQDQKCPSEAQAINARDAGKGLSGEAENQGEAAKRCGEHSLGVDVWWGILWFHNCIYTLYIIHNIYNYIYIFIDMYMHEYIYIYIDKIQSVIYIYIYTYLGMHWPNSICFVSLWLYRANPSRQVSSALIVTENWRRPPRSWKSRPCRGRRSQCRQGFHWEKVGGIYIIYIYIRSCIYLYIKVCIYIYTHKMYMYMQLYIIYMYDICIYIYDMVS